MLFIISLLLSLLLLLSFLPLHLDGVPGIVIRNILSVPLIDIKTNRSMGAIHLLNKLKGKISFTELDECFAAVYADMAVSTLLGCLKFQQVSLRSEILSSILDAPSQLLVLLPDVNSMFKRHIIPIDVLKVLEDISMQSLRCYKVKAFLVSDYIKGSAKGVLLSRDLDYNQAKGGRCKETSKQLGIAGSVCSTKKWIIQMDGDNDVQGHPECDIDRLKMSCITVPIVNIHNNVIACLQLVLGHGSPKIDLADSRVDGITFRQAAEWLSTTLAGVVFDPLIFLLW